MFIGATQSTHKSIKTLGSTVPFLPFIRDQMSNPVEQSAFDPECSLGQQSLAVSSMDGATGGKDV